MTLNFMWVHSRTGQSEVGSSFDYSGEEHLQPPLWAVHCEYFVFVLEYNSCLSSIYIIHPQNKFRASASTQLQPRRSLVSWDAPLRNLLKDGGSWLCPGQYVHQQLYPGWRWGQEGERAAACPTPGKEALHRSWWKKLSSAQLDDLLVMIGAKNFIRWGLVFHIQFIRSRCHCCSDIIRLSTLSMKCWWSSRSLAPPPFKRRSAEG